MEDKIIIDFSRYRVTTEGDIFNIKTGKKIKPCMGSTGYLQVCLTNDSGCQKTKKVHKIVAEAFLGKIDHTQKYVVDHIDRNKLNNNITNLRIITNRKNTTPTNTTYGTGVSYYRGRKKPYRAMYKIKNKSFHIGYFFSEKEAHKAYLNKIKNM